MKKCVQVYTVGVEFKFFVIFDFEIYVYFVVILFLKWFFKGVQG